MGFEELAPTLGEHPSGTEAPSGARGILDPCTPQELADLEISRRDREAREAAEVARERAKAEAEAETQRKLDLIDATLMPGLQDLLEAENAKIRVSEQERKDVERFQAIA